MIKHKSKKQLTSSPLEGPTSTPPEVGPTLYVFHF